MSDYIDIVFDGPPSHESGRFIEVENAEGASINFGEWLQRPDGYWVLRISQHTEQRIAELTAESQETLRRVQSAARTGMDAATRRSHAELEAAQRLRAESRPEALESERDMNARLTEELAEAQRETKVARCRADTLESYATSRLCGDHRDKWPRDTCLMCELERARAVLEKRAAVGE